MGDQDALMQLTQGIAGMAVLPITGEKRTAPADGDNPRRKQLRHYDLLPAQILNPMGASGVETISNEMIWSLMSKGNKAAMSFSEICFPEPERHSVAISRFAEVYTLAIQRLKTNQYTRTPLKESVYEKIMPEADNVLAFLSKLNQAELAQRQVKTIRNAIYAKPGTGTTTTLPELDEAAKALFDWLSEESILRSVIAYFAGAGCYFSAYSHERAIRCFIKAGGGTCDDFVTAMRSRASMPSISWGPSTSALDSLRWGL